MDNDKSGEAEIFRELINDKKEDDGVIIPTQHPEESCLYWMIRYLLFYGPLPVQGCYVLFM